MSWRSRECSLNHELEFEEHEDLTDQVVSSQGYLDEQSENAGDDLREVDATGEVTIPKNEEDGEME